MHWFWFDDTAKRSAIENMAADQRLLELRSGSENLPPIVRIYRWGAPAVTFGRLQRIEEVRRTYPNLELAQRPSGGRAVLHGEDLTVTVALCEAMLSGEKSSSVGASFRLIAQPVIDALNESGLRCGFGEGRRRPANGVDCFAHTASCDIVNYETNEKIVGCAQRRVDGAILQQMSISRFREKLEFPAVLQHAISNAFGVTDWVFVDTKMALCYTGPISEDPIVHGREQL